MKEREALKLALEGFEKLWLLGDHAAAIANPYITAIKEALAQPEQEPVGEAYLCDRCHTPLDGAFQCPSCGHGTATKEPVYTTPPQRKPLTNEQIRIIGNSLPIEHRFHSQAFARAIEAKLKEKNTK